LYQYHKEEINMVSTSVLAKVDTERLQRGVEGLTAGAYTISVTRQTEQEVSAYVTNGDGKTYSVTLTEDRSFCGCGDAMFRGKCCKHAVALALYVIRNPQAEMKEETTPTYDLTLAKVRRGA
jgi:uncharacterized Zn finger protein